MFDQINWEMLSAFTVLLTFHGSIFLSLAKNLFITKQKHDELAQKMDDRFFYKNGQPIYALQTGCDRRASERDRRRDIVEMATCKKIDELKTEIKELRTLILDRFAIAAE